MHPCQFLRLEGVTVLLLALAGYVWLDGPLWLLAVLAFAPDLSTLGYLGGPRLGSRVYNDVHTYTLPLAFGAGALWTSNRLALLVALVWAGHIGADRALGYGLEYESGFRDTHLSTQAPPVEALDARE